MQQVSGCNFSYKIAERDDVYGNSSELIYREINHNTVTVSSFSIIPIPFLLPIQTKLRLLVSEFQRDSGRVHWKLMKLPQLGNSRRTTFATAPI